MNLHISRSETPTQTLRGAPTLVITLGDSGLQVLQQALRLFSPEDGSQPSLSSIHVLHIGLDEGEANGQEDLRQMLPDGVFGEQCTLMPGLSGIGSIYNQANEIDGNLRKLPRYTSWLDTSFLTTYESSLAPGDNRLLVRLAYFYAVDKVVRDLRQQIKSLLPKEFNVFLVGAAGSALSGIFLDVSYTLLRQLSYLQAPESVGVTGLLLLPQACSSPSMYQANAYSVLREVHHYLRPQSHYKVSYQDGLDYQLDLNGPPWQRLYLLPEQGESAAGWLYLNLAARLPFHCPALITRTVGAARTDRLPAGVAACGRHGCVLAAPGSGGRNNLVVHSAPVPGGQPEGCAGTGHPHIRIGAGQRRGRAALCGSKWELAGARSSRHTSAAGR